MFSTLTFRDALPISAADDGSTSEVISKRLPTKSFLATANRSEEHTSELQSLRHLVCRLLLGNKANLDYLSNCAGTLHRRPEQQGDDTDYAAALSEAMSYLGPGSTASFLTPSKATKIIFITPHGALHI